MITAVGPALVLKLGGSLAETGRITGMIEMVARASRPVAVVPGGGPFADAVRAIQPQLAISDRLAHRLALLSMHQMGLVITSRHPRFAPAKDLADIARVLAAGGIPVWLPITLQYADDTLPADWTATSDALAARLAERMGCGRVALIKSCPVPAAATLAGLTEAGIVDTVFGQVVTRAKLDWHVYGAGDEAALASTIGTLDATAPRSATESQ